MLNKKGYAVFNKLDLIEICKTKGIKVTADQQYKFQQFFKYLLEKNKEFNLTAIVDPKEIALKHLVDSLMITKLVDLKLNSNLLDIGAGAGFPSVPIAIVRSDLKILQIDSLNKRIVFLKDISKMLNLVNVESIHGRAENLSKLLQFREQFNFVVARAVAPLNRLVELCLPFVKKEGLFIAFKGRNFQNEIDDSKNAISKLGGYITKIEKFKLDDSVGRVLILIKKISQTPTIYPRNYAKITKNPL